MERNTYYVQLEPSIMGISEVKTSENTIQYEINATLKEKQTLEKKMNAVQKEDLSGGQILARVHDESKADHAKNEMQTEMKELYQKIYELGTPATRELFEELGIDSL
ncbi:hypothetical protein [Alteribacillus bidgolensis]|uniref:Uncharacterized protein n=1 Tax=Alteribacillus bidgolensis TaxID=930129 RepID=A0A1G8LCP1_9BACI|nr:hypothetical protein [Alteribacillus bidgolensis]SDI53489.1 hypothetical protein SAMN05216352_108240 [Alteribacillus bidgolensis]